MGKAIGKERRWGCGVVPVDPCATIIVLIVVLIIVGIVVKVITWGSQVAGNIGQYRTGKAMKQISNQGLTIQQPGQYQVPYQAQGPRYGFGPTPIGLPAFCSYCGISLASGVVRCPNCGRTTGSQLPPNPLPATSTSRPSPSPQVVSRYTLDCPKCGTQNPESFQYCYSCAMELRPKVISRVRTLKDEIPIDVIVICPKCGAKNSRTDIVCRNCENDLAEVKKLLAKKYAKNEN